MLPYFGLASGFLTGKYRTEADFGKSVRGDRMAAYLDERGRARARGARRGRRRNRRDAGPDRAGLARRPAGVTAPIASATSVAQLEELLGVMTLKLSGDQVARLSAASAPIAETAS